MKADTLFSFHGKKPYSLLSPKRLKKKKKSVLAHVACIPACEWVVNSQSVVLAADRRKQLACGLRRHLRKGQTHY